MKRQLILAILFFKAKSTIEAALRNFPREVLGNTKIQNQKSLKIQEERRSASLKQA
jgi:hypothetical protein